jgi:hypothetical protein
VSTGRRSWVRNRAVWLYALAVSVFVVLFLVPLVVTGVIYPALVGDSTPQWRRSSPWKSQTECLETSPLFDRAKATLDGLGMTDSHDYSGESGFSGDTSMYADCSVEAVVNGNQLTMEATRYAGSQVNFVVAPHGRRTFSGRTVTWRDDTWYVFVAMHHEKGGGTMPTYDQLRRLAHSTFWFDKGSTVPASR